MPSIESKTIVTAINGSSSNVCCNTDTVVNVTNWCPLHPVDKNTLHLGRYAVIILNQPILLNKKLMINIWNDGKLFEIYVTIF